MTLDYDFWAQAKRSFFLLFGGIWLVVGSVFAVIGGGSLAIQLGLLAPGREPPAVLEAPEEETGQPGAETQLPGLLFAGIGVVFGGVGGFLFFRELSQIRYRARLFERGMSTRGTVTAVEETSVRINKGKQWRVGYSYPDEYGREQAGRTSFLPPDTARTWRQGDSGEVRFDREAPTRSIWIG